MSTGQNVQVVVRCRPLNAQEIAEKLPPIARVDEATKEVTIEVKGRNLTKTFTYDAVYGPSASQRDVYNGTVLPIVQEVLEGYNCTIFAYGQTGTGKTYTMEGNRDTEDTSQLDSKARLKASREAGVISRSINTIFEYLSKTTDEYTVKVSHLELYNEELYDLLDPDNKGLKIFEDPNNPTGSITIRGLTEVNVYNPRDIFNILEKSWNERRTAETHLNKESSRSHCIFSITIHMKERNGDGEDLLKVGKLNLVDLAGSENVGKSGMSQKTSGRQEAGMINKSLLAFGRVITALVDQSPHIPYRESKLTRLLQDSLGGRTKTCIIATISPASVSLDETIGTLEYAHRAKSIKNQPQINAKLSKKEFLGDYAQEIDSIRSQLDAMRRKEGVYMPHEQYIQMTDDLKNKSEEIEILLEEKKVKEKEFQEINEVFDLQTKELRETQSTLQDTQLTLETTIQELNDTLSAIEATRNDLFEHKVVLVERAKVEARFHQEANTILATLSDSLRDIEGLHAKVARQEEVAAVNNASWADKKDAITKRIKANEELLQRFIEEHTKRFSAIDGTLHAFVMSKEGELNTLQTKLRELSSIITASQKQLNDLVELRLAEAQAQRDALKLLQTTHAEATAKQLTALTESVESKVSSLVTTITSYEQRTKAWSEAKDADLKENASLTGRFTEEQKSRLENFRAEASRRIDTEIASYADNRQKIAAFMDQQKSETREFQNKILATLSVMLADFVAHKEHAIDGTLQTVFKTFEERVDELARLRGAVNTTATESIAEISEFDKESASKITSLSESVKKMGEITSGISKINTDQARQITVTAITEVGKVKENNAKNIKNLETKLAEMQEKMAQAADAQRKQLQDIVASFGSSTEDLNQSLTASLESTKSSVDKWSEELSTRNNDAIEFNSSWKEDIARLSEEISKFDLQRYVPSGNSPAKKAWSYPTELPRTRPEAEIIAQYRNGGEYVPIIADPIPDPRKQNEPKSPKEAATIDAQDLASESNETPEVSPPEPQEPEPSRVRSPISKSKSRPLAPTNVAPAPATGLPRATTRPTNLTSTANRGTSHASKPTIGARENPRPGQQTGKPILKRTNSQQQLVGAVGRRPLENANTTKQ